MDTLNETSPGNLLLEDNLTLVAINDLLGAEFFIPAYQRGYRWTDIQVNQLLNDVWDFRNSATKRSELEENPFYCLQPIVAKQRLVDDRLVWEVIDGQQRLTTILIILSYFNKTEFKKPKRTFSISYETRIDSDRFLSEMDDESLADSNVDYYHIHAAYRTIEAWFDQREHGNEAIRGDYHSALVNTVKVIWYKIVDGENGADSIDVFTRLNIGKIPLTNAELIKALFLQKSNFDNQRASLKQLQIAAEWDMIERQLQNDAYWYFIYDPENPLKYENRIEYIFDLMKGKTKEDELHHTFNEFSDDFVQSKKTYGKPDIDVLWLGVKKYFLTFDEWYGNKEFYHLVGFLVDCGVNIDALKKVAGKSTKLEFTEYLKGEVRKQVNCNVEELEYGKSQTRKVLLLFNIQTILATENADIRFPFDRYKDEDWDIEHVRSQTTKKIPMSHRRDWAMDILHFLTGIKGFSDEMENGEEQSIREKQVDAVEALFDENERQIGERLLKALNLEKIDDDAMEKLVLSVSTHFRENDNPEDIDSISNLALLDKSTNRAYKNAMFPIKRMHIMENDMNGVFVPICTKNLFHKSYSRKMSDMLFWKKEDAEDYMATIIKTLKPYLPKQ